MTDKLWFGEKAFVCAMERGYQTNFNLTVQYRTKFSKAQLSQAFRRLIYKHPIFAYSYFRTGHPQDDERTNGENLEKRPLDVIRFEDVFVFVDLSRPLDVSDLQRLNSIRFSVNSGKLTYRIIVHEFGDTQYLSFVSDHAMRDGNSSVYFHLDFLAEMRDDTEFCAVLFQKSDLDKMKPLHPTLDKLSPVFMVPWNLPGVLWKYWVSFLGSLFFAPKFSVEPITTSYKCKFRHFNIAAEDVELLRSNLKQMDATLTPYITVVGHHAFQKYVVAPAGSYTSNARISINARRYFPALQDELRYSVCVVSHSINSREISRGSSPRAILADLQIVQQSMRRALKVPVFFVERSFLQLVNIWKFFKGVEGTTAFLENLCVSNLGKIHHKDIVDSWFSQDCNAFANVIASVVSTPEGGMNVVVSYHENLGEHRVEQFIEEFKDNLVNVICQR